MNMSRLILHVSSHDIHVGVKCVDWISVYNMFTTRSTHTCLPDAYSSSRSSCSLVRDMKPGPSPLTLRCLEVNFSRGSPVREKPFLEHLHLNCLPPRLSAVSKPDITESSHSSTIYLTFSIVQYKKAVWGITYMIAKCVLQLTGYLNQLSNT